MRFTGCLHTVLILISLLPRVGLAQSVAEEIAKSHSRVKDLLDQDYQVESEQLARTTLTDAKRHGIGGPDLASCLEDLAQSLCSLGRYIESQACLDQAMEIWKQTPDRRSQHIVQNMKILSVMEYAQGKYEKAERIVADALRTSSTFTGSDRADRADLLEISCMISLARGDLKKAESEALQAVAIREEVLGKMMDSSLATSLGVLATVYLGQGAYDRAKSSALRSLAIRESQIQGKQIDIAVSLEMVGMIEMAGGHQDKALPYYVKALKLREEKMNINSRTIDNDMMVICFIYTRDEFISMPDISKNEHFFVRWLEFRDRVYGTESPQTMLSLVGYAELLDRLGRKKDLDGINKRIEKIENQKK